MDASLSCWRPGPRRAAVGTRASPEATGLGKVVPVGMGPGSAAPRLQNGGGVSGGWAHSGGRPVSLPACVTQLLCPQALPAQLLDLWLPVRLGRAAGESASAAGASPKPSRARGRTLHREHIPLQGGSSALPSWGQRAQHRKAPERAWSPRAMGLAQGTGAVWGWAWGWQEGARTPRALAPGPHAPLAARPAPKLPGSAG